MKSLVSLIRLHNFYFFQKLNKKYSLIIISLGFVFFLLTIYLYWPGINTFDNSKILNDVNNGYMYDWHSPYYQIIVYLFSDYQSFLFVVQILIYDFIVCFFILKRQTWHNIPIGVVLLSPVMMHFFGTLGKDQFFLVILVIYLLSIFYFKNIYISSFFSLLLILIRPNFLIFNFGLFMLANSKHKFSQLLIISISLTLIYFQDNIFNLIGYKYVFEYPAQYFMFSDIINGAIEKSNLNLFYNLTNINSCEKFLSPELAINLKKINNININGIWNIDTFFMYESIGVCHIKDLNSMNKLKDIWLNYIFDNPYVWFKYRLFGFLQFFIHESTSIKGIFVQLIYQPILIFIIYYFVLIKNKLLSIISLCLILYFISYFFYGFGYDLRYWLPVYVGILLIYLKSLD